MMIQKPKKLIIKAAISSITLATLIACGGGGDSGPTFALGPPRIEVKLNPATGSIPLNSDSDSAAKYPSFGSPSLLSMGITTYRGDIITAPTNLTVAPISVDKGAMAFMDTKDDHQVDCPTTAEPTKKCPGLYHSLAFTDTPLPIHAYFYATPGSPGGEETIRITTTFTDGATAQKEVKITIGNSDGGKPASGQVTFDSTIGVGQEFPGTFRVLNSANAPAVGSNSYDSVEFVLDDASFNDGGRIKAVSYKGASASTWTKSAQATTAQNGIADFEVRGANTPRQMNINIFVDSADNNVTNGYSNKIQLGTIIVNVQTAPVVSDVERLTFTGDFANAVKTGANVAPLGRNDLIVNQGIATYARSISVIAADQFGRPAGKGGSVKFYLIDTPTTGYPTENRGEFIHQGKPASTGVLNTLGKVPKTGNVFEIANPIVWNASTPTATCKLAFGMGIGDTTVKIADSSFAPYERGYRSLNAVITGTPTKMTVDRSFNAVLDSGYTAPWIVGCGGTKGTVLNGNGNGAVISDVGVATDILNYPVSYIGHNFVLVAEYTRADGRIVSAVMNHWYLAETPTAKVTIANSDVNFASVGTGSVTLNGIKVSLTDNNGLAIPSELLHCTVGIKSGLQSLIEAVRTAEAAINDCKGDVTCIAGATPALTAANVALAAATFNATVTYDNPATAAKESARTDTAGNVYVNLTLTGWPNPSAGVLQCGSIGKDGTNVSNIADMNFTVGGSN